MSYRNDDSDWGFVTLMVGLGVFWLLLMGMIFYSDNNETKSEDVRYSQCLDAGKDWDDGECTTPSK